jgi:hypothetical protein
MNRPGTYSSSSARVLAQAAQRAAALGAIVIAGGQFDLLARDVIGDRPALRLVLLIVVLLVGKLELCGDLGDGDLARLERQLKLLDRLRRGAKPMVAVAGQLVAQLRPSHGFQANHCRATDQQRLRLHFGQQKRRETSQFLGVFGQRFGNVQHGSIIPDPHDPGNPERVIPDPFSPP